MEKKSEKKIHISNLTSGIIFYPVYRIWAQKLAHHNDWSVEYMPMRSLQVRVWEAKVILEESIIKFIGRGKQSEL